MHRRTYLLLSCTSFVSVSGCSEGNGDDFETGVIVDQELDNLWEEHVDVAEGQTISVEATDVGDGEELQFQVGDGTAFVHTEHIYEDRTDSYTFESDGQHQIQFHPKRHEPPMNDEVTVFVRAEITE